jgi:hypothetical protein
VLFCFRKKASADEQENDIMCESGASVPEKRTETDALLTALRGKAA